MVEVEMIDLASLGVELPRDRVGVVIAQPHLSLTNEEPFTWIPNSVGAQLDVIRRTLDVSEANHHGVQKTHFTLFPEYSIPGLVGVTLVQERVEGASWPVGTVVIAGIDALSRQEYQELLAHENTGVHACNSYEHVHNDEWVNCVIIWVKSIDGQVFRWVQPKLAPSWPEQNVFCEQMYRGKAAYIFKGKLSNNSPYIFSLLVCFDWIATIVDKRPFEWILDEINSAAGDNQLPVTWFFVVQHNPHPSHQEFLSQVAVFFNQAVCPNALRSNTGVVFANTAGSKRPKRVSENGGTSVVVTKNCGFKPSFNRPTVSSGGSKFRDGCDLLRNYEDAFFRERGACIHSFAQINPTSLVPGPAGRAFAVDNAFVFSVDGIVEPRAPDGPVAAIIKWLNDELDDVVSLASQYGDASLGAKAVGAHDATLALLRPLAAVAARRVVRLATPGLEGDSPDDWGDREAESVAHLVSTLDILGVTSAVQEVDVKGAHAMIEVDGKAINIIAMRARRHEECAKHANNNGGSANRLTLLISRDDDNTQWASEYDGSFLDRVAPGDTEKEPNITDPQTSVRQIGYQALLNIFRESETPAAAAVKILEFAGA